MCQSNNIDDAMNDAIMVIDHPSKREDCFYIIFVLYIFIFILYWVYSWAMTGCLQLQPACTTWYLGPIYGNHIHLSSFFSYTVVLWLLEIAT